MIEVLVALSVVGLTLGASAGLSNLSQRADARSRHALARLEVISDAQRVLRSLVGQAVPQLQAKRELNDHIGTAHRLTLYSFGPDIMVFDRPRPINLSVIHTASSVNLVLEWIDPETTQRRSETIAEGFADITLAYFVKASTESPTGWTSEWGGGPQLPAAVKATFDIGPGEPALEIVVKTPVVSPLCRASTGEKPCRETDPR